MTSHSSNNLREGMVSDEEDISLLFCTICFHDLNHHAYNVLEHSELGVALCCICHEKFTALMKEEAEKPRASEDEDTDICHWCYDNDSENSLFICGDGSRCPGQFCAHCLRNNLGEDFLSNVENREEWTCLMCNDQPLKGLRQAFEEGKARSWYAKIDMHKSSSQSSSSAIDESLQQHFIDLLCLLKDEEIKCTEKLSHAALCDQEILVLDELKQDSTTRNSMMEVAKNEVQLLQSVWQRHYDIINLQISYIMDELNNLEIDPRSLPYFQDDFDESREHFHDKAARLEADKEVAAQIAQRNSIDREKQDDEEDSDEHHSDDGMDEIDGEDVKDTLGLMKMQADDDDLVLKFVQHNDIPKSAYPSVFEKTVPVEVLKALAYASKKEVEVLSERYNVPRHIAIVMGFASDGVKYPDIVDQWSFAKRLHRGVKKALYHSISLVDQSVLCSHYKLDDICATSDIGEADDLYDMYTKHKERTDQEKLELKFSLRDIEEAQDDEDQERIRQEEKLRALLSQRVSRGHSKLSQYEERILSGCSLIAHHKVEEKEDLSEETKVMGEVKIRGGRRRRPRVLASGETKASGSNDEGSMEIEPELKSAALDSLVVAEKSSTAAMKEASSSKVIIDLTKDDEIFDIFKSSSRSSSKPPKTPYKSASYFPENVEDGILINSSKHYTEQPVLMLQAFKENIKQHQIEAVRFIWVNVMKSLKEAANKPPKTAGCIVAHCMGLGKTLTVVAFTVSLLINPIIQAIKDPYQPTAAIVGDDVKSPATLTPKMLIRRILVVTPKNTVQNWHDEYKKWTPGPIFKKVNVKTTDAKTIPERKQILKDWFDQGGVMIMSSELFKSLVGDVTKDKANKDQLLMRKYLLNPGPDIIVADEVHQISNSKAQRSLTLEAVRTKRRIGLTGSPLQNNLNEYYAMVDWVKKRHLFTLKEYRKSFVDPIVAGQNKDSTSSETLRMKKRIHVLYKRLQPIVDRKDASELQRELNPKREFIVSIKMTEFQKFLYRLFLAKLKECKVKSLLFKAYQALLRVWNHPFCIIMQYLEKHYQMTSKGKLSHHSLFELKRQLLPTYHFFKTAEKKKLEEVTAAASSIESLMMKDGKEDVEIVGAGNGEGSNTPDSNGPDLEEDAFFYSEQEDEDSDSVSIVEEDGSEEGRKRRRLQKNEGLEKKCRFTPDLFGWGEGMEEVIDPEGDEAGNTKRLVSDIHSPLTAIEREDSEDPVQTSCGNPKKEEMLAGITAEDLGRNSSLVLGDEEDALQGADDEDGSSLEKMVGHDWWKCGVAEACQGTQVADPEWLRLSNKVIAALAIISLSVRLGDQVLLFSQSLHTLNIFELFLRLPAWNELVGVPGEKLSEWVKGRQFLRIDGSTEQRQDLIDKFNKTPSIKLMLISTRAGNMGINLQAANRVIIFDASWNPVHDLQAIYRAYRFGQKKSVFVYRLVAAGSMEERIYKRQVTKQTLAARVVDGQMPDNHFSAQEQAELMTFGDGEDGNANLTRAHEILRSGTQDIVMLEFLKSVGTKLVSSIEDQDGFLADRHEAHLNEEERKAAEEEFERELQYLRKHEAPRTAEGLGQVPYEFGVQGGVGGSFGVGVGVGVGLMQSPVYRAAGNAAGGYGTLNDTDSQSQASPQY